LYSVTRKAAQYKIDFGYEDPRCEDSTKATLAAKLTKEVAKKAALQKLSENWHQKPLHGQFAKRTKEADINRYQTFSWTRSSGLKSETEGFIFAAQDQSLKTKNYLKHIMKTGEDSSCRYCHQHQETIDHLVSACPTLAKSEYLVRHNKVAQYVHWKVCQHYGIQVHKSWYQHEVTPVAENDKVTILWDFSIQTDRTIKANRPDLVIRDKKDKTCLILDVSIPADRNTAIKTFEKLSKYKDLDIELAKSWNVKTKTLPIIIGALGVINKSAEKYLKEVPGNIPLKELQKITLLGTSHILRKALSLNAM
jgi:hypothetical protein